MTDWADDIAEDYWAKIDGQVTDKPCNEMAKLLRKAKAEGFRESIRTIDCRCDDCMYKKADEIENGGDV